MNPQIDKQLARLEHLITTAEQRLDEARELSLQAHREREKLQVENWQQSKELAATRYNAEDSARLKADLDALTGVHGKLRQRLQELLKHTKALGEELRQ